MQSNHIALCVMIGIPCSGKSHFVTNYSSKYHHCYIFEVDKYEASYNNTAIYDPLLWKKARKQLISDIKNQIISSKPTLDTTIIFVDDNNQYKSMIKKYYQLAVVHNIGFSKIYLPTDPSIAISLNKCRTKALPVPDTLILKMSDQFKASPPHDCFIVDNYNTAKLFDFNAVEQYFLHCISHPLININAEIDAQKEKDMILTKENVKHVTDLILRQLVKEGFTKLKERSMMNKAKLIVNKKEELGILLKSAQSKDKCDSIIQTMKEFIEQLVKAIP